MIDISFLTSNNFQDTSGESMTNSNSANVT